MKELHRLTLKKKISLDDAWQIMEQAGIELAYAEESDDLKELYVYLTPPEQLPLFSWIEKGEKIELPVIDWDAQWEAHGLDFHDGAVHVAFEPFGREAPPIQLKPGPGFGDLSHPTTRLVLQLMARFVDEEAESVIDIGCGSGVLTLAAVALGARFAYGIDIDSEALTHALANAQLNQMNFSCNFCLPDVFVLPSSDSSAVIVMNMIASEQRVAWASLPMLHHLPGLRLISGIRLEERQEYLQQAADWGWLLKEEIEKDGWLGFSFS